MQSFLDTVPLSILLEGFTDEKPLLLHFVSRHHHGEHGVCADFKHTIWESEHVQSIVREKYQVLELSWPSYTTNLGVYVRYVPFVIVGTLEQLRDVDLDPSSLNAFATVFDREKGVFTCTDEPKTQSIVEFSKWLQGEINTDVEQKETLIAL